MLDLDEIIEKLADRNISEICRRLNLSKGGMSDIINRKKTNPTYKTLKKLSDYLEQK